jgi:hypothetical protein
MTTCGQCRHWTLDHQGSSNMDPDGWGSCSETGWRYDPARSACASFCEKRVSEIDCRKCPHARPISADCLDHEVFRCEKRNAIMLTYHPSECNFITLKDVCFSCQHFKHLPEPNHLSHGACPQHWYGAWFDGLKSMKCSDYIPKHGIYPKRIRVVRFKNK